VANNKTVDRYPWYDVVKGNDLQQGDIFFGCPIPKPTLSALEGRASAVEEVEVQGYNAIVLSQSCDLAIRKGGKCDVEHVILCPIYSPEDLKDDPRYSKRDAWEQARKGRYPSVHVLNKCTVGPNFDFMLVDLTEVLSIDVSTLREFAEKQNPRVRLNPPYREHLSQAFARLFMRVGLPVDIPAFA
jgi:hypothetical protein